MTRVHDVTFLVLSICDDCDTAVTVPTRAWDVAKAKRHTRPPDLSNGLRQADGADVSKISRLAKPKDA
jgi:hypothetical protein